MSLQGAVMVGGVERKTAEINGGFPETYMGMVGVKGMMKEVDGDRVKPGGQGEDR